MKIFRQLISLVMLFLFMTNTPLVAKQSLDVSLALAKAKKFDEVIDRVNSINRYVNQYILETADESPTRDGLINHFSISNNLFISFIVNENIEFIVVDNKTVYKNLVPNDLTTKEKKFYENSQLLHPQAVVKNLNIETTLDPKVQLFLKNKPNNLNLDGSDKSKLKYKPDGKGGYEIYRFDGSGWKSISSNSSSSSSNKEALILDNKEKLEALVASTGDMAYVKKDDSVNKYIYNGSTWLIQSSGATASTSSDESCKVAELGVVKYSADEDCMQRCKADGDKHNWECIESGDAPVTFSCYALKLLKPKLKDGVYTIDPDGKEGVDEPFEVYCDMTTDGGGWTAIKYTYDSTNPITESTSHQESNYYLSNEVTNKLLGISSTFLFREDSSDTLGKLKDKAYPYIKNNIEKGFGWFKNTYGRDYLTAWITPIDGKNIPDAKQGSCDNFKTATYKYVFDSCNNGSGSHTALFSHMRMKSGSYSLKKQNMIFIGGGESNTTIPEIDSKTTTDKKAKTTQSYCPTSGYSPWGSSGCVRYYTGCHGGSDILKGSTCSQSWKVCPSGYPHKSGAYGGYCYGGVSYTRPSSGSCNSGYKPGGVKKNGKYTLCVQYKLMVTKTRTYPAITLKDIKYNRKTRTSCPSGYPESGGQCIKSTTTKTCPTGYKVSGSICVLD